MKKCTKCLISQDITNYTKDKTKKDGLYPSCKLCNKKGLTRKELGDIKLNKINIYGIQICTKCNKKLTLDNFRKDGSKRTGYYSSCNDCLRKRTGAKKHISVDGGRSYYNGYRKYILERDGNKCVISGVTEDLHIHHIKTRGAGGTNEYNNLITLSGKVHREKAHGKELDKYRKIFLEYTSQFKRPIFWDKIMEESKKNNDKTRKKINERNNKYMKNRYKKLKEEYKQNNNGLSYWQVLYRKKKNNS